MNMLFPFSVYIETCMLIRSVVSMLMPLFKAYYWTYGTFNRLDRWSSFYSSRGMCCTCNTLHDICLGLALQSCHFTNCINPCFITSNFCSVISTNGQTSRWWWQSCQLNSTGNTDDDILLAHNQSWPHGNLKCRTNIMLLLVEISSSPIKWQVTLQEAWLYFCFEHRQVLPLLFFFCFCFV